MPVIIDAFNFIGTASGSNILTPLLDVSMFNFVRSLVYSQSGMQVTFNWYIQSTDILPTHTDTLNVGAIQSDIHNVPIRAKFLQIIYGDFPTGTLRAQHLFHQDSQSLTDLKNLGAGEKLYQETDPGIYSLISSDGTINFTKTANDEIDLSAPITLGSVGTGTSLVNDGVAPDFYNKSLAVGTGLSIADNGSTVTITNTSPASTINVVGANSDVRVLESPADTFTVEHNGGFTVSNVATTRGTWANSGTYNSIFGYQANAPGSASVVIGSRAGRLFTGAGDANILIGNQACETSTGGGAFNRYNIAIGDRVAQNGYLGQYNTILGVTACQNSTLGDGNVLIGGSVCANSNVSTSNVVIGGSACYNSGCTSYNVILGLEAAYTNAPTNTVVLGAAAARNAAHGSGEIVIGYQSCMNSASIGAGAVVIGNTSCNASAPPANSICLGNNVVAPTNATLAIGNSLLAPTATATAGAATLPSNPVSFMPIWYNNVQYRIPLYSP